MVVSRDNGLATIDATTGSFSWFYDAEDVRAADCCPERGLLAFADVDAVTVYDLASGRLCSKVAVKGVREVVLSPDGRLVTTILDQEGVIWRVASRERVARLEEPDHEVKLREMHFASSGTLLLAASSHWVHAWNASNGRAVGSVECQSSFGVLGVAAVRERGVGHFIGVAKSDWLGLYPADCVGHGVLGCPGHQRPVCALSFARNDRVVSADVDGRAKIWKLTQGSWPAGSMQSEAFGTCNPVLAYDGSLVRAEQEDRDGETANFIALQRPEAGVYRRMVGSQVLQLAVSPEAGHVAYVGSDEQAWVWDTFKDTLTPYPTGGEVEAIAISGGRFACACSGGTTIVWDIGGHERKELLRCTAAWATSLALGMDGARLAVGRSDGSLEVWNLRQNSLAMQLAVETRDTSVGWSSDFSELHIPAVAFSHRGHLVACARFNQVLVWRADDGTRVGLLDGHPGYVGTIAFSPDDASLASAGDDGSVVVWDLPPEWTRMSDRP